MDEVAIRQGLQRHPKTGVFRLRRAVPDDLRYHYDGRREILESYGTRDLAEATLRHDRRMAELTEDFDRHRKRAAALADDAEMNRQIEAALSAELQLWLARDAAWLRYERPTATDLPDALQALSVEIGEFISPPDDFVPLQAEANAIAEALPVSIPVGSAPYWRLLARLNDAHLERLLRRYQALNPTGVRPYPTRQTGFEHVKGGGFPNPETVANGQVLQTRVGSEEISVLTLTERFWADPNNARATEKTKATAWITGKRALLETCGESLPVRQVTKDHAVAMRDLLLRAPPYASQRFPGMSLAEAAEKAAAAGEPPINRKTADTQLKWIKKMFAFAVSQGLIGDNPTTKVHIDVGDGASPREPWFVSELNVLFASPIFTGCMNGGDGCHTPGPVHHRGGRFWVPLVCLFQGFRMNEVCKFYTDAVFVADGIPAIRLRRNAERNQSVKRAASERVVPMHPTLVELGFLDFALAAGNGGPKPLFPELSADKYGSATNAFSKWFRRLREKRGLTREGVDFHSLRHTFADALRETDIPPEKQDFLGGWKTPGSQRRSYGRGFTLQSLAGDIGKVQYPGLDLSGLRSWSDLQSAV